MPTPARGTSPGRLASTLNPVVAGEANLLCSARFRFDTVQLPCPTLRTAERANRYGLSVMQRGQLLQL